MNVIELQPLTFRKVTRSLKNRPKYAVYSLPNKQIGRVMYSVPTRKYIFVPYGSTCILSKERLTQVSDFLESLEKEMISNGN